MIKNERQYKISKSKLEKWLKTQKQLKKNLRNNIPDWLLAEQNFGTEQQIKQLKAEITDFEDTAAGTKSLPDPGLVDEIPYLLISWRIARRMTQRELADRAGIHENLLQKYEAENYGGASYNTIVHIAHVLKESGSSYTTGKKAR